jgi:hypothetical protein
VSVESRGAEMAPEVAQPGEPEPTGTPVDSCDEMPF